MYTQELEKWLAIFASAGVVGGVLGGWCVCVAVVLAWMTSQRG